MPWVNPSKPVQTTTTLFDSTVLCLTVLYCLVPPTLIQALMLSSQIEGREQLRHALGKAEEVLLEVDDDTPAARVMPK